jgi:putative redox protein
MKKEKVTFPGSQGGELSGHLNLPADQKAHTYVVFAHCFTCNKNFNAVKNIALGLTQYGFAVLSFDFTGLGASEGDFSDTNFSSNLEDLLAACDFLSQNYKAPELLVGHSLGGAAVLLAAGKIKSVKAVATIGAPSHPDHVLHLIKDKIEDVKEKGVAEVNIGGRPFKIKSQFIDDLKKDNESKGLENLRKAVMILHSPQDKIVDISNAKDIYLKAHHPKSFVSLDGADHLLQNAKDSIYAGQIIAVWADRYLENTEDSELETDAQTVAAIGGEEDQLTTQIVTEGHHIIADEPEDIGGNNYGPTPYGLLTSSLAACTAITLRMYANHKKWPVEEVLVHVNHEQRHDKDVKAGKDDAKISFFDREIEIKGDLTKDQIEKMISIANRCPVHQTLESEIKVETKYKAD